MLFFPPLFLTLEFTIQVQQTNETRPNLVIVNVKPSENEKFKAMVLPEMTQSLKVEPGVSAMYVATVKEQSNRWVFFEIYANDETYTAHQWGVAG